MSTNTLTIDDYITRRLRRAHARQFVGEDWQLVATELTNDVPDAIREEVFAKLSESPDPYCECGFCATAAWKNEEAQ